MVGRRDLVSAAVWARRTLRFVLVLVLGGLGVGDCWVG